MAKLTEHINAATVALAKGDNGEAARLSMLVLNQAPKQPQALHVLGVVRHRAGRNDEAAQLLETAIQHDGSNPWLRLNLGIVYKALGRLDDSVSEYGRAVDLKPDLAPAWSNLSSIHLERGFWQAAATAAKNAIEYDGALVPARLNLAAAMRNLGRLAHAREQLQAARSVQPENALVNARLGMVMFEMGDAAEGEAMLRRAVDRDPNHVDARLRLGSLLHRQGKLDDALAHFDHVLAVAPDDVDAQTNRANVLKDLGRHEQAVATYRTVLARHPDARAASDNLLYTLNLLPGAKPADVYAEHVAWGQRVATKVMRTTGHTNDRHPSRPLRVGYVSPDFRSHAVARFIEPVLEHHDPKAVESIAFAEVAQPDEVTHRLESYVSRWHSTVGLTDGQVAELIRHENVDVLVDLAGHTAGNRLRSIAQQPAPVTITWLGYPNTTGLDAVQYRLTDEAADPENDPTPHVEELIRLPLGVSCFAPPRDELALTPPPHLRGQPFTFGTLSNPAKLNDDVFDVWGQLLCAVPDARLVLVRDSLSPGVKQWIRKALGDRLIASERIVFVDNWPSDAPRMRAYEGFDVALDTFPYAGHTTTCEALWMGVPVVTMRGRTTSGRMSASVLTQVGLTDMIAEDAAEYVDIADVLASDPDTLVALRRTLRDRMLASPLCDGARFTRELEDTYRYLWRRWVARVLTAD